MHQSYSIYGLTVRVPFPCASLPPALPTVLPDVCVEEGMVPNILPHALLVGDGWQAAPGCVLVQGIPGVGRFLVEDGRHVTLERAPTAHDDALAVQFLDAALALALQQRGVVVLHANAAVTPGGAVAIGGESGVGKSTTLAALLAHGCTMLTDDITVICRRTDGGLEVMPGMPLVPLTDHSAAQLGQDISGLPRFPWRRMKSLLPTRTHMASAPAPLRALYILQVHEDDTVHVQPLRGVEKFAAVKHQLYGPLLPTQHTLIFPLLCAIVRQVDVFDLRRPAQRWTAEELVEVISNT